MNTQVVHLLVSRHSEGCLAKMQHRSSPILGSMLLAAAMSPTMLRAAEVPNVEFHDIPETQSRTVRISPMEVGPGLHMAAFAYTRWRGRDIPPDLAARIGEDVGVSIKMAAVNQQSTHVTCKKIVWHMDRQDFSLDAQVESEYEESGEMEKITSSMPYSLMEILQASASVSGDLCEAHFSLDAEQLAAFKKLFEMARLQEARDAYRSGRPHESEAPDL